MEYNELIGLGDRVIGGLTELNDSEAFKDVFDQLMDYNGHGLDLEMVSDYLSQAIGIFTGDEPAPWEEDD